LIEMMIMFELFVMCLFLLDIFCPIYYFAGFVEAEELPKRVSYPVVLVS